MPLSMHGLLAAEVSDRRLRLRVDVAEDLGDAVVGLVGHVQALARDGQIGSLMVQIGVINGDRSRRGEALQRSPRSSSLIPEVMKARIEPSSLTTDSAP